MLNSDIKGAECLDDELKNEVVSLLGDKKVLAAVRLLVARGLEVFEIQSIIADLLNTRLSFLFILRDWDIRKPDEEQREVEERFFRIVEERSQET